MGQDCCTSFQPFAQRQEEAQKNRVQENQLPQTMKVFSSQQKNVKSTSKEYPEQLHTKDKSKSSSFGFKRKNSNDDEDIQKAATQIFQRFDEDRDGYLNKKQIEVMLIEASGSASVDESDVEKYLMIVCGKHHSNKLSKVEFIDVYMHLLHRK